MSADSWITSKRDSYYNKYLEIAIKNGVAKEEAQKRATEQTNLAISKIKQNLYAAYDRLDTATTDVNNNTNKIIEIGKKLTDPNLSPQDQSAHKSHLDYYQACFRSAEKQQREARTEIQDITTGYNEPDIIKSDFSELFNNLTDFINNFTD
jgi:hypothetical protein